MCRIGEARVPGPDDHTWTLGVCNPSGLQGKQHVLSGVPADIVAISETHLSKQAKRNLTLGLRSTKSRFKNVLSGAPMAPRSTASDAGQWGGVAFASAYPCRTVAAPWPEDLYETGRIQFAAFFTPAAWITGSVVYGYPEGRTHLQAQTKTEAILDFAFQRLAAQPGPRFFAGDWNFTCDVLQITSKLRAAGWVEVQELHQSLTGKAIEATCKGVSRKDFLWLSPELALGFLDLQVDHQTFADHAVMVARFSGGSAHLERFAWPCPKPVPWTSVPDLPAAVEFCEPSDPTAQYALLWKQKESLAKVALHQTWMPSMGGRAQQSSPKRLVGRQAPLKQGRHHDVKPGFYGFSAVHAKQFKQLRRLQNYCRWVDQRPAFCSGDNLHGIDLWNSILRASGFGSSFSSWWLTRHYVSPSDPPVMPCHCPSPSVAHQIYDAVLAEVRLLEQRLQNAKVAHRRAQHEHDKTLVFRDVDRPSAEPVESLLHSVRTSVVRVDDSECAVELEQPVQLLPEQPVWIGGHSHEVIHAEHDKIWLQDVTGIEPSAPCVQTKLVGDLRALFEAFHEQWQLRWCRHDNVPFSHWQELLDFAKRVVRPCPLPHLAIDPALLLAEASRKKKRAATGLDGISRQDLLQADATTLQSLTNIYQRAEHDGTWPVQLIAGKVHSLAKTETASAVGDYRPITIFGLPYRVWSSVQSRYLLQHADQWVDDSVFGNRKGRQAADLWSFLLQQIEDAYASGDMLAGLSADLEKCFNCIPRFPALCLAVLVGTPDAVTTAWSGALASMRRHFKVRDSFSSGFLTSTGLAEGCGLSVFGMLLVDHLFACWMRFQTPAIQCLTYVDDWQTLTSDPDFAVRQLDLIERFAGMVDLTVDKKKTFGWATCPHTRSLMRASGIRVLHHARELGGHLGISRQYTNCTLTQRIEALEDFWSKLKSSKAKYLAKLFMLRAVAWPRGLHAVASVPVGDQIWLNLRRQAVRALGWKKPGVNPAVLLGLVESAVDPQFTAILWTLRAARSHYPCDFWHVCVAPLAHGDLDLPPNAPASVLLHRVQALGVGVSRAGLLIDRFGSFCPQHCNVAELELRLLWAWIPVVAQKVAHRPEFSGLWQVDLALTRRTLAALSADDQALYRLGLAGGLFTESYKSKWTDQTDACKWCGQPDHLRHRYWECPQHQDLRDALAPDAARLLDSLPAALALRGWALLPPTWQSWIQLLVDLPPVPLVPLCPLRPGCWTDLFTDGSCLFQTNPLIRCAAWSVIVAPGFHAAWTPGSLSVLGASYLPGLCQTAFRAELFAVAFAVHCAADAGTPVRIWTDCLGVLTKYNLLVHGHVKLNPNRSNSDLWAWVLQSVDRLGSQYIQLHKVPAHRTLQSAKTKQQAWMFFHNDYADRAARLANQARPTSFWDVWEQHSQAVVVAEGLFQQVQLLHLAVGRRQVQSSVIETGEPAPALVRPTRSFTPQFCLGTWNGQLLPKTGRLFGAALMQKLCKWFLARLVPVQGDNIVWLSFTQMYLDFQMTWGHPGPVKVQKQWVDAETRPYLAVEQFPFRVRVRWFRQFVKHFIQEAGLTVALEQCRPKSMLLQAYLPAASVPWDARILAELEDWLGAHLSEPCVRSADALRCLPIARRQSSFQV